MIKYIRKRDGRMDLFQIEKIANAIYKSFQATSSQYDYDAAMEVALIVESKLEQDDVDLPTVELVQDTVEETLIEKGYGKIAKAYILYRAERMRTRDRKSYLIELIGRMSQSIQNEENVSIESLRDIDFQSLTSTYQSVDLMHLFDSDFSIHHLSIKEPQTITMYAALACSIVFSQYQENIPGLAIHNFDFVMAPGVRKSYVQTYYKILDKVLHSIAYVDAYFLMNEIKNCGYQPSLSKSEYDIQEKKILEQCLDDETMIKVQDFCRRYAYEKVDDETYQAIQLLIHQFNILSCQISAQNLLVSIDYGYDTSCEGRMVINNVLRAIFTGLGDREISLLPIQIFKVKEGINKKRNDPNCDLYFVASCLSEEKVFPYIAYEDEVEM